MRSLVPSILFFLFSGLCAGQTQFGVGVGAGTLGIGPEGAVSVTKYSNVSGGFNFFDYSDSFTKDGIGYAGKLKLRSVRLTWDQYFPHTSGFHVSAGALVYNGNSGSAAASVPGGQAFSLGGTTFYSSTADPVSGNGALSMRAFAPMVLVGFGNLLPRGRRHFGISFEAGVVFQGSPSAKLNLGGSSCFGSPAGACVDSATNSIVQADVTAEQNKLNNDLNPFKYYPVISIGFSWKLSR